MRLPAVRDRLERDRRLTADHGHDRPQVGDRILEHLEHKGQITVDIVGLLGSR